MSRLLKFLAVAALLSGVLAGCGGKLDDTYLATTLKDAARGDVVSPSFKYSFDTPSIIGAAKNVALVREGNIIEFFVGDGLADKMGQLEGKKFVVYARKYFTPYVHFMVDYIIAGADTIQVGEVAVQLPNTRPAAQFTPPDEYEAIDSWSGCPMPGRSTPANCPAGSNSASPWPGRWPPRRACCCSTSRSRRSMRACACACAMRSAASSVA